MALLHLETCQCEKVLVFAKVKNAILKFHVVGSHIHLFSLRGMSMTNKPKFTARKKRVMYAGRRWRLIIDRGTWLLVHRRGVECWIPGGCAT